MRILVNFRPLAPHLFRKWLSRFRARAAVGREWKLAWGSAPRASTLANPSEKGVGEELKTAISLPCNLSLGLPRGHYYGRGNNSRRAFCNAKFLVGPGKVVVGEGDVTRTGWNIGMCKQRLSEFVESFYYKNGDFLRVKLASLRLAFKGIPSGGFLRLAR